MPIKKVKGGYKVANTKNKPLTKAKAIKQLKAIKASQNATIKSKRGRRGKGSR